MNKGNRNILTPQYMKDFHCIGKQCEDSCCIGWKVDIDHESYKLYQKNINDELTVLFDKHVTRNRTSNHNKQTFAKIKLLENGNCPFLNEEKLCMIYIHRGEECLSDVCSTYPRYVNKINGIYERSATMSCPEAARLALLNENPMEFDEDQESSDSKIMLKHMINTHDIKLSNKPMKYFWELRVFTISVLQNRRYSLKHRLILLGLFYQKLEEDIKSNKVNEIPELIASYTNMLDDVSLRQSLNNISKQYTIQIKLLKEITDERIYMKVSSSRYLECFNEFLIGLQYTSDSTDEEIGVRYQKCYTEFYQPFMNEHEYILENHLVNYVFKNVFPFTGEKSVFDAYIMLVLNYSLIKMHLIGMAGYHKELTVELVLKMIQSFSKTVEHNNAYLQTVSKLIKDNNFNTMAYMAILINS